MRCNAASCYVETPQLGGVTAKAWQQETLWGLISDGVISKLPPTKLFLNTLGSNLGCNGMSFLSLALVDWKRQESS